MQVKPRIVIYGVGQYGGYLTRFAVQKGWPIIAAFNRAGPKVGCDLGRLAGLDRDIGVIVQDCDTADYRALQGKADIAMVAQTNLLRVNMPAYGRLMDAGLNILCHGAESIYPQANDTALAAEIDARAIRNGVTFTGGGIWDMSRIWSGILVAGPCTELRSLFHSSITDVQRQGGRKEQAYLLGLSFTIERFMAEGLDRSPIARSYKTILELVLSALGYTVTDARAHVEPAIFDEPIYSTLLDEIIPAGGVVGMRIVCEVETREGVTGRSEIDLRLFQPGEVEHMFWSVDGMPHTRVRVERDDSAHATAANLFNRIPDVIAAPPGIRLITEFGPLKHSALSPSAATRVDYPEMVDS